MIEKLRALADAATPGPWSVDEDRNEQPNIYGPDPDRDWIAILPHQCVAPLREKREHDAAFIVAARQAVPALCNEVDRLCADHKRITAERDEYRAALADLLAAVNPHRRYEKNHQAKVETVRERVRVLLKHGPAVPS